MAGLRVYLKVVVDSEEKDGTKDMIVRWLEARGSRIP